MRRRASGLFGEAEPQFLGSTQRRRRPMCVHVRVCALVHRLFRINAPSSRRAVRVVVSIRRRPRGISVCELSLASFLSSDARDSARCR